MAKRKRLDIPTEPVPVGLETKSLMPAPKARMPIADVAGEAAGRAALEEVAREMSAAEEEGRVVKKLPLSEIVTRHLSRDRLFLDAEEMAALTASIAARGQQTPIEVLRLPEGGYGLISGLRRLEALRGLGHDSALALIKQPDGAQGAYQAMVEENEIRAGLSFYERANIAVVATEQGVYPDVRAAMRGLFAHAPRAKRSKISKFVTIRNALGAVLSFPSAIPEHLGLALAQALDADPNMATRISMALKAAEPEDAQAERKVLEQSLARPKPTVERTELMPGLQLETKAGRAVLSGKAIDEGFIDALKAWLLAQADVSHAKH